MKKKMTPYDQGKVAFQRKQLPKPLDDKLFIEYYNTLVPNEEGVKAMGMGRAIREAKQAALREWKQGWMDAKVEAENPEPVKKKTSKKKVSKKKSKK